MMGLYIVGTSDYKMLFIQIYFFLGLVMVLVVLWDFKTVPKTASRYTKKPVEKGAGFGLIVLAVRNFVIMASVAFFLWPAIIWREIYGT
jgi:hypothetical protein